MGSMMNKRFFYGKYALIGILFGLGVWFDDVQTPRLMVLSFLLTVFVSLNLWRDLKGLYHDSPWLYTLDVGLIFTMEFYSRYVINYFFHVFYILLILEFAYLITAKKWWVPASLAIMAATVKHLYLLNLTFSVGKLAEAGFFIMMNLTLVITAHLFRQFRKERNEKDALYEALLASHLELEQYALEKERYAVIEERTRLARDMHDTLGHDLMACVMQLEMAERQDQIEDIKDHVQSAKSSVRAALGEIRKVVRTLRSDQEIKHISQLDDLVHRFKASSGIKVLYDRNNFESYSDQDLDVLYRVIQEALTNVMKHAKASLVHIKLHNEDQAIKLTLRDNGQGKHQDHKGFGLKGMQERLKRVEGELNFYNDNGFVIDVIIKETASD